MQLLYAHEVKDWTGLGWTREYLRETFGDAAAARRRLEEAGCSVAYSFIDPLLDSFEAANRFYFGVLGCERIRKLNPYRSGAGPVHAVSDAMMLVDNGHCDAVFLFGYEPLLSSKNSGGKQAVQKAMDIFGGKNLLACYNSLGELLCRELDLTHGQFREMAALLYDNFSRTYSRTNPGRAPRKPGPAMDSAGAPLFLLTDCANPNLDFAGGVIMGNEKAAKALGLEPEGQVGFRASAQATVAANLDDLSPIVGTRDLLFPHLRDALDRMRAQSGVDFAEEWRNGNLLLDVYTCYPPIPLGFLMTGGFVKSPAELASVLEKYEVTVSGGMSLNGAPWNNPVLSSIVTTSRLLAQGDARYGLVHGNGGVGEAQGAVLLEGPGKR